MADTSAKAHYILLIWCLWPLTVLKPESLLLIPSPSPDLNESAGMGRPLRVIKRTFIFFGASLGLVSKKRSRVINAGQVRREFIDIYCHSRYGRRAWARSDRSVWVELRESPTWASPSARTCIARTILHACLPMYPVRIRRCAPPHARVSAPSSRFHIRARVHFSQRMSNADVEASPDAREIRIAFWYTLKGTSSCLYFVLNVVAIGSGL